MRHARLLLVLNVFALVGCFTPPAEVASAWRPNLEGLTGPDVVCIDVAVVEAPLGDRYVNHNVWTLADEQVVPLERKGLVEQNGWRIGQISGAPPDELLTLVTSERTCANPRQLQARSGKAASPIVLGPTVPHGRFTIQAGDEPLNVELDQAQFTCEVTPVLQKGGAITLRFVPVVRHGQAQMAVWKPNQERSGWAFQMEQPTERYPQLGWEVTLGPNDWLLIGARPERPNTLGHQAMIRAEETPALQRLLVIRTRSLHNTFETTSHENAAPKRRMLPLAARAGLSVIRGSTP